jgi:glutaconate CoA-transferase subunit B
VNRLWTDDEIIAVASARLLEGTSTCFVGIGLPSAAAVLALRTHAPGLFLIYESGTLGANPDRLPLSVADDVLADSALTLVSVPEIFNYWLQPGRIDVGLLGAAQVDRFANLNSTVVGAEYDRPAVRLPGAGGAPEIASAAWRIIVMIRQSPRTFVNALDFITTVGHGSGATTRTELGMPGRGPAAVVTDIGLYEPHASTHELVLTALQPGRTVDEARAATGWELLVANEVGELEAPTPVQLETLRGLESSAGGPVL